mgnify:CR=1 FL=1
MKKNLPKPTTEASNQLLPDNHKYVLLADGTLARKCKPMLIGDTAYYNLRVDGKPLRIRKDVLVTYLSTRR